MRGIAWVVDLSQNNSDNDMAVRVLLVQVHQPRQSGKKEVVHQTPFELDGEIVRKKSRSDSILSCCAVSAADTKAGGHPATGRPVGSPDERCAP